MGNQSQKINTFEATSIDQIKSFYHDLKKNKKNSEYKFNSLNLWIFILGF